MKKLFMILPLALILRFMVVNIILILLCFSS